MLPAWEAWGSSSVVYLSPDAEEVLEELDESKVYCIGGLVDRTVAKGASLDLAARVGVQRTARLPIKVG